jgi:hypothetical protein
VLPGQYVLNKNSLLHTVLVLGYGTVQDRYNHELIRTQGRETEYTVRQSISREAVNRIKMMYWSKKADKCF